MHDMTRRNSFDAAAARGRCLQYRKRILDISQQVQALHISSAYSCTEIVDTIYHGLMRRNPDGTSPDTFLMSKGHGCMILVCDPRGHGRAQSRGSRSVLQAEWPARLPSRLRQSGNRSLDRRTRSRAIHGGRHGACRARTQDRGNYLHGIERRRGAGRIDLGGCAHGLFARPFQPRGFCRQQRLSESRAHVGDASDRSTRWWKSSRRSVGSVSKSMATIPRPCSQRSAHGKGGRPFMLVGKTTKGKGISYMENVPIWHYRSPSPKEYEQGKMELEAASAS